ncbi:MAG: hypothetical protein KJ727_03265 [Acidobacteria bacterium]|nr:hypothetical protein [Acidobacteriota bacterium]MBU4329376.1 hypothetical protein [Acidobacteriota bacterium]MBU4493854.1 hypothetical protein [Acidobacteriota bacterium]MCG2816817.1 hypothetical protein [Candidatus Aminicenantes bacterium]
MTTAGCVSMTLPFLTLSNSCSSSVNPKQRPNILWITVEDISPLMSCCGYEANPTPPSGRLDPGNR